jgi:hypothetical protein
MTPKEKAEELVDKFYPRATSYASDRKNQIENAKECALIAVDEILNVLWHTHKNEEVWRYYLEVKQEIEKL